MTVNPLTLEKSLSNETILFVFILNKVCNTVQSEKLIELS